MGNSIHQALQTLAYIILITEVMTVVILWLR
jgi:hypothetical protein